MKHRRKFFFNILFLIWLFGAFSTITFARTESVTFKGRVIDKATGEVLVGVNIQILESNMGKVSGISGEFIFEGLPKGDYRVRFSHVGYTTKIVPISLKSEESIYEEIYLETDVINLSEISVGSQIGLKKIKVINQVDLALRPIGSSQDVLPIVPGLFMAQHAGGGKAEQIFLRGFDIDHGTDISLSVDGLPVNMVSHAHGQGYSDLHFLIPETISKVDFDKGTYYADRGNHSTAGFAEFSTKHQIDRNEIKLETGQFDSYRGLATIKLFDKPLSNTHAYIATEFISREGYFESSQNLNRFNLFGKYNTSLNPNLFLTFIGSTFTSEWTASGQIPQRGVDNNTISRFGAIDDTEGGNTSRTNLSLKLNHFINNDALLQHQAYFVNYDFRLFSNFTFFLLDPVNGDQIRQTENRNIYGYNSTFRLEHGLGAKKSSFTAGIGVRYDDIDDVRLSRTLNRTQVLSDVSFGQIDEVNVNSYINEEIKVTDKLTINPSLRFDFFSFQHIDELSPGRSRNIENQSILSPKLNFEYVLNANNNIYLKSGFGFHTNDTRVVVVQLAEQTLPRAFGTDLGIISKPTEKLLINPAIWFLELEQEFVFVGDEGIVEPSGRSRRFGADLTMRYQFNRWFSGDIDLNVTRARFIDEPAGQDRVPLAPEFTSIGGLNFNLDSGFSGSLRYRFIRDRAANEDNSVTAEGYFVVDALMKYSVRNIQISLSIENLFDVDWNEAQFDTESRLRNEPNSTSEIHFTPGTPFYSQLGIQIGF